MGRRGPHRGGSNRRPDGACPWTAWTDLTLAVDEAAALILEGAAPGALLTCRFRADPSTGVKVSLAAPSAAPAPATESFAWLVLTALVDEVAVDSSDGKLAIELHVRPTPRVP